MHTHGHNKYVINGEEETNKKGYILMYLLKHPAIADVFMTFLINS